MPEQQKGQTSGYEGEEAKNELFAASPENRMYQHKQTIISRGLKANTDFLACLKFIKELSSCKTFEYAVKEYAV